MKKLKRLIQIAIILVAAFIGYQLITGKRLDSDILKGIRDRVVNPAINDIEISSAKFKKDILGIPELNVVFRNNGNDTIDRLDFCVKCYDIYGDQVNQAMECNLVDIQLKPGAQTSKYKSWLFSGFDNVKSVEIAVMKYHTTSGKTIEVPMELLEFRRYAAE